MWLTIYTNHMDGSLRTFWLVNNRTKGLRHRNRLSVRVRWRYFSGGEKDPPRSLSKSAEQTQKSGIIASLGSITAQATTRARRENGRYRKQVIARSHDTGNSERITLQQYQEYRHCIIVMFHFRLDHKILKCTEFSCKSTCRTIKCVWV